MSIVRVVDSLLSLLLLLKSLLNSPLKSHHGSVAMTSVPKTSDPKKSLKPSAADDLKP